ncbi:MAG: lipopolysaccharide biosynthesis protein, partial [Pseudonocardiales bacterium]|nr:lipopolysaccharide biosynthesis protein [Pseudonocardiales bacterium]
LEQQYLGADDERAHFNHIVAAFRDERYLRVNGKPLFYVFRPELMPDAALFVDRWQSMALSAGLPGLYLVAEIGAMLGQGVRYSKAEPDGFDAAVYMRLPARTTTVDVLRMRAGRKLLKFPEVYPYDPVPVELPPFLDATFVLPNVFPNWDNTPRAGRAGVALTGATPAKFQGHVRAAVEGLASRRPEERLLFVKSWNEWAEGNHLEPDLEYGRGWLEALREGLQT